MNCACRHAFHEMHVGINGRTQGSPLRRKTYLKTHQINPTYPPKRSDAIFGIMQALK